MLDLEAVVYHSSAFGMGKFCSMCLCFYFIYGIFFLPFAFVNVQEFQLYSCSDNVFLRTISENNFILTLTFHFDFSLTFPFFPVFCFYLIFLPVQ